MPGSVAKQHARVRTLHDCGRFTACARLHLIIKRPVMGAFFMCGSNEIMGMFVHDDEEISQDDNSMFMHCDPQEVEDHSMFVHRKNERKEKDHSSQII